jgi:hypothetical protein
MNFTVCFWATLVFGLDQNSGGTCAVVMMCADLGNFECCYSTWIHQMLLSMSGMCNRWCHEISPWWAANATISNPRHRFGRPHACVMCSVRLLCWHCIFCMWHYKYW